MVIAITMVRDEADVVAATVRHMAANVDEVIVADNGSVDGTREILAELELELPDAITVVDDAEPGYYQSRKMTALADRAAHRGADWVVPFDADEIWLPRTAATIAGVLESLSPSADIADALVFNHVATPGGLKQGGGFSLDWRMTQALPMRKVAARCRPGLVIEAGNHGAHYEGGGWSVLTAAGNLEIRHFPYRSPEQFIRKARNGAAAYAAAPDIPAHIGAHWRDYGALLEREGESALAEVFLEHFYSRSPVENPDGLVLDPCPVPLT